MFNDSLIKTSACLIFLITLAIVILWAMKRFMPEKFSTSKNQNILKVISQHNLGGKERLSLIEFNHQYLLIGITPQKITLLATHSIIETINKEDILTNTDQIS
ncbi:flagellar biosynthetic protein FliO [Moellerella wisconsensis]|uniref:flagellar biosynthetic protein FliO n=1 Tax=Moellerella wisconsensis TaxID=158849 RepID=UPI003B9ED0B1